MEAARVPVTLNRGRNGASRTPPRSRREDSEQKASPSTALCSDRDDNGFGTGRGMKLETSGQTIKSPEVVLKLFVSASSSL